MRQVPRALSAVWLDHPAADGYAVPRSPSSYRRCSGNHRSGPPYAPKSFATRVYVADAILLIAVLAVLKPAATILCVRCGAPGGLFTPSLTAGALLGGVLGYVSSLLWPGVPPGLLAILGAGAVLAATTQGPISSTVLLMELTGRNRSFVLPLLLAATLATLVARSIEARSIYNARLTKEELDGQRQREATAAPAAEVGQIAE